MKLDDIPQDIEPRVGDILEIEQGDVCFEVRIIGITADGYLCEQDNVQGAILLEGTVLDEADATDIEDFLRSGGKIQQLPYRNARKEKSAHYRLASRHIGGAGHEQTKGKLAGLRGRAAAVNVSGTGKAVVGEEDIEESGLQYYTGVKKHGEKYMKLAAKAGREGASQEELGRLRDRYSKAEKTDEGRFDEPLTGWHIVYRNSGNPVHATPSFETKEQAQKYLMTKMFANHQDFKVVHTAGVGMAEGSNTDLRKKIDKYEELALQANKAGDDAKSKMYQQKIQSLKQKMSQGMAEGSDLPPKVIEMIKKIAQSSASPEHKKAAIDALVAKYSKKGVAEGPEDNRQWSNKDNEQFRRAVRDIEDNFGPNDAWTKTKQRQIKQQIKTEPMSGPKGKLPEQGVAEGYTGRETKDGTWRVFKDGKAVAVAGPFKSREEAAAWIKKQKTGVAEGSSYQTDSMVSHISQIITDIYPQGGDKNTYMKLVARKMPRIVKNNPKLFRRAFGIAYDKFFHIDQDDDFDYTDYSMRQGELGNPKRGVAEGLDPIKKKRLNALIDLYREANDPNEYANDQAVYKDDVIARIRLEFGDKIADRVEKNATEGVAEGPEEHEYSLSMGNRQRPGSDRLDTDSQSRMDSLRAQEHDLKQRTIDILLKRHPTWERSDLELAPLRELIDMLRKPANEDMDEAKYQGREVPLGKKMAGDVKKSKVYVRKPNGKVVKVNFGDKDMKIKKSNPARRKSFRARHNCQNPGPRWKARYWSCRSW